MLHCLLSSTLRPRTSADIRIPYALVKSSIGNAYLGKLLETWFSKKTVSVAKQTRNPDPTLSPPLRKTA